MCVFLLLIIIRYIFYFTHQYYLRVEGEIFVKNVKDFLFAHQLQIHNSVYREKGIGKYLLRYSGDINSLKRLYLKGTISAIVDAIMVVFALFWLYTLNSKGALAILILSVVFYIVIRLLNIKVEAYSFQKRNVTSGQLSYVSRTLNSILGVVLYNKQPVEFKKYSKKIFMGDAGSMFIGLSVIWLLTIGTQGDNASFRPVTALWICAIPLMDMLAIVMRRYRKGKSPFKPDRDHLHHILQRAGLTSRQTLVIISFSSVVMSLIGVLGEYYMVAESVQLVLFVLIFILYNKYARHFSWKYNE